VYRRLLLLAVPAALAGCQDAADSLGPAADTPMQPVELAAGAGVGALSTPRIAFTSMRSGGGDIYWTNPSGAPLTRLTKSSDYERAPAWSWDNKRIALVRPRKDASDAVHDDIYIINADGTGGHWALGCGAANESPPGVAISGAAVRSPRGRRYRFDLAPVSTSDCFPLTTSIPLMIARMFPSGSLNQAFLTGPLMCTSPLRVVSGRS
jgi:hypothetical protein